MSLGFLIFGGCLALGGVAVYDAFGAEANYSRPRYLLAAFIVLCGLAGISAGVLA